MTDFYARKPDTWSWELQSTLLFMMTSVLKSRTNAGLPSNAVFYDEDVNVYLAGLLASYIDPQFMQLSGRYISPFDIDIAQMARAADDRARYTIYKVNADHMIVMAGIFEPQLPEAPTDEAVAAPSAAIGRGPTYYQLAASYGRALARRQTAACEVLGKLSRGFVSYVTILKYLRGEYFNLIERLGSRDMAAIQADIDAEAVKVAQTERIDRLLDVYSSWLRSGEVALLQPMRDLVQEIQETDPTFEFELPGP